MENTQMTFTKEEVQEMMMKAFIKGETWGVTYSGWFSPSEVEKSERAAKDCEEIYRNTLVDKIT